MTEFILIRHGQSGANIGGYFAGQTDSPLTDLGLQQARAAAEYIAGNFTADAVYASDLSRAGDTGKAVADRLGLPLTMKKELREIHAGQWQGVNFARLMEDFADSYSVWLHDIGRAHCPGGESVAQLQRRFIAGLEHIGRENADRTLVIATHATPIRALMCHCSGKGLSEMKNIPWVSNASITRAQWDGKEFCITRADICDHLGGMVSRFGKNV